MADFFIGGLFTFLENQRLKVFNFLVFPLFFFQKGRGLGREFLKKKFFGKTKKLKSFFSELDLPAFLCCFKTARDKFGNRPRARGLRPSSLSVEFPVLFENHFSRLPKMVFSI